MTVPVVSDSRRSNFPFIVETKPTENWGSRSAHRSEEEAQRAADIVQSAYPRVPIRIKHYVGGPL